MGLNAQHLLTQLRPLWALSHAQARARVGSLHANLHGHGHRVRGRAEAEGFAKVGVSHSRVIHREHAHPRAHDVQGSGKAKGCGRDDAAPEK